jgi:hypothetical protein
VIPYLRLYGEHFNALLRYRRNLESDNGAQADLRVIAGILDRGHVRAGLYGQRTNWYANAGVAYRF